MYYFLLRIQWLGIFERSLALLALELSKGIFERSLALLVLEISNFSIDAFSMSHSLFISFVTNY